MKINILPSALNDLSDGHAFYEKQGDLKDGIPTHAARLLFGEKEPPYSLHI